MSPQPPAANLLRPSLREFQAAYKAAKAARAAAAKTNPDGSSGPKSGTPTHGR